MDWQNDCQNQVEPTLDTPADPSPAMPESRNRSFGPVERRYGPRHRQPKWPLRLELRPYPSEGLERLHQVLSTTRKGCPKALKTTLDQRLRVEILALDRLHLLDPLVRFASVAHRSCHRGIYFFLGGSAPCSAVVHRLGLSPVNPIVHGLPFERFVQPDSGSGDGIIRWLVLCSRTREYKDGMNLQAPETLNEPGHKAPRSKEFRINDKKLMTKSHKDPLAKGLYGKGQDHLRAILIPEAAPWMIGGTAAMAEDQDGAADRQESPVVTHPDAQGAPAIDPGNRPRVLIDLDRRLQIPPGFRKELPQALREYRDWPELTREPRRAEQIATFLATRSLGDRWEAIWPRARELALAVLDGPSPLPRGLVPLLAPVASGLPLFEEDCMAVLVVARRMTPLEALAKLRQLATMGPTREPACPLDALMALLAPLAPSKAGALSVAWYHPLWFRRNGPPFETCVPDPLIARGLAKRKCPPWQPYLKKELPKPSRR